MDQSSSAKGRVFFEVEKVIGVSSDGNVRSYKVQWAPAWVSSLQLVGCEHLIQEFLQRQPSTARSRPAGGVNSSRHPPKASVFDKSTNEVEQEQPQQHQQEQRQEEEQPSPQQHQQELHKSTIEAEKDLSNNQISSENSLGSMIDIVYPSDSLEHLQHQHEQQQQEMHIKEEEEELNASTMIPNNHHDHERSSKPGSSSYGSQPQIEEEQNEYRLNEEADVLMGDYRLDNNSDNQVQSAAVLADEEYLHHMDSMDNNVDMNDFYEDTSHNGASSNTFYSPPPEHNMGGDNSQFKRKLTIQCKSCDKAFAEQRYLIKHRRRMHPEEDKPDPNKRLTCQYCGRTFRANCDLVVHIRTHTNERPFKCEYCDKSFTRKDIMTEHIWTHTKDRPYKCDRCSKSYNRKYLLENHQQKKHANDYHSMAMTM